MEGKKIVLALAAILAVLVIVFLPGFSELEKLREENRALAKRIELLEEQNKVLGDEIARLEDDPDYLERKAREKLGIIKKGEIVYKGSGRETIRTQAE